MKRTISIAALVLAFLLLIAAAICFQVSYFFLTEPEPVKFYVAIMTAEGKSFSAVLLPLIAAVPVLAVVGVGLLWWAGRDPSLKKPIRWTGIVIGAVWFVLCLNFLGFIHIIPESILPGPAGSWVTTSSINLPMLLRLYFRVFRPGLSIAPIGQAFPWLASIVTFPSLAFLLTMKIAKG
jgi:hypothetical protein